MADLSIIDSGHLAVEASDEILMAFRRGTTAEIRPSLSGDFIYRFSLIGFTAAYNARTGETHEVDKPERINPVSVVARKIPADHRWGLNAKDLRVRANPYGDGNFVYFPIFKIAGYERVIIWYVRDNQAVKLNGATHHVTPAAPFPRDMGYQFWRGTGLSGSDATEHGLAVVFGR